MFQVGERVAIAPHTDTFMSGYRYGTITAIGRKYVTVSAERIYARRIVRFLPEHLAKVTP